MADKKRRGGGKTEKFSKIVSKVQFEKRWKIQKELEKQRKSDIVSKNFSFPRSKLSRPTLLSDSDKLKSPCQRLEKRPKNPKRTKRFDPLRFRLLSPWNILYSEKFKADLPPLENQSKQTHQPILFLDPNWSYLKNLFSFLVDEPLSSPRDPQKIGKVRCVLREFPLPPGRGSLTKFFNLIKGSVPVFRNHKGRWAITPTSVKHHIVDVDQFSLFSVPKKPKGESSDPPPPSHSLSTS